MNFAMHKIKLGTLTEGTVKVILKEQLKDLLQVTNRSGATKAVVLDISKAFDRVWDAGLLRKFKSYGISGQIFCPISSFLSNRRL